MKFHFKAQHADGTVYESERETADKFALYQELKASHDTLLFAEEVRERTWLDWRRLGTLVSRISYHEKVVFAKNLGAMLEAGLPISKALDVLLREAKNKKLRRVLSSLADGIRQGKPLSETLDAHRAVFSPVVVSMVRAGEESGSLAASLKALSAQMEGSYRLNRRVRGALLYPAMILTVMATVGVLMLIFVVPELTGTFKELAVPLPLSTRIVIGVSDFLAAHTLLFLGLIGLLALAVFVASRTRPGKRSIDLGILHIPLVAKIVRETNTARTAHTLSSLLSAGVTIVTALRITGEVVQNTFYRGVLTRAGVAIEKGAPLSEVFLQAERLYPPFLGEMIGVGEETGKLPEMLREVGVFYESEVEQKTRDLSTVIEPFLMVFIGIVVGFFAVAMISPTYSLMTNL